MTTPMISSPFSLTDRLSDRYTRFRRSTITKYQRTVRKIQFYSSISFWVIVAHQVGIINWPL